MKKHLTHFRNLIGFIPLLLVTLRPRVMAFANGKDPDAREDSRSIFLANHFLPDKENWVQVSPFGDFANSYIHPDTKRKTPVIQRFRKEDAEEICNAFNAAQRKTWQPFGIPFYVGHPDHPSFAKEPGHADSSAKGHGKKMEVRAAEHCANCANFINQVKDAPPCADHGLFMQTKWNEEGRHLVGNEMYHAHSVNWNAVPSGEKDRGIEIWRPISVKSVGFTNSNRIPVSPATLANEFFDPEDPSRDLTNADTITMLGGIIPPKLKLIAGFKAEDEVTIDQIIAALEKKSAAIGNSAEIETLRASLDQMGLVLLCNAEGMADNPDASADHADFLGWLHGLLGTDPKLGIEPLKSALTDKVEKAGAIDRVKKSRAAVEEAHARHRRASDALQEKLANAKRLFATDAVERLVKSGHILSADRETQITELANCEDIPSRVATLVNEAPKVKVTARSANLPRINLVQASQTSAKWADLMADRATKFPNESYDDRFKAVANSSEGSALLANMKRPGEEQ